MSPHADTPTFKCVGCGRVTPDTDEGCLACDLCEGCTPAEGNCEDCGAA